MKVAAQNPLFSHCMSPVVAELKTQPGLPLTICWGKLNVYSSILADYLHLHLDLNNFFHQCSNNKLLNMTLYLTFTLISYM